MNIRQATIDDTQTLFEWRNDKLTRQMSRNANVVAMPDHIAWLQKRLARENPDIYITEKSGVSVGTFRIDDAEISYTVAPNQREKGVATEMLIEARKLFGVKRAEIKPGNVASIKAATKAGHIVVLI